jgi:hypothetical protein
MANKVLIVVFLLALTTGCNKSEGPDSAFISIEEFEQQVLDSVTEQATNCGKVAIGDSPFVVNTCVSDSFIINTPFYAVYIQQGTDSSVASAITMNTSGVVEHWLYDSDISGGSNSGSRVTVTVCENPSVIFHLDDMTINVIECST